MTQESVIPYHILKKYRGYELIELTVIHQPSGLQT